MLGLAVGGALLAALGLYVFAALTLGDSCGNTELERYPSPDGKLELVVFILRDASEEPARTPCSPCATLCHPQSP